MRILFCMISQCKSRAPLHTQAGSSLWQSLLCGHWTPCSQTRRDRSWSFLPSSGWSQCISCRGMCCGECRSPWCPPGSSWEWRSISSHSNWWRCCLFLRRAGGWIEFGSMWDAWFWSESFCRRKGGERWRGSAGSTCTAWWMAPDAPRKSGASNRPTWLLRWSTECVCSSHGGLTPTPQLPRVWSWWFCPPYFHRRTPSPHSLSWWSAPAHRAFRKPDTELNKERTTIRAEINRGNGLFLIQLEYLLCFLPHSEQFKGVALSDESDEIHGLWPVDGVDWVVDGLLKHHFESRLHLHLNFEYL